MEHKPQNVATEGTIDFDDEYSEDDKYLNNIIQAPLEVPQPKINLLQEKDEIQINPEEEITDEENIIYDPKVKELNELDINNKQAIIDILMDEDLIEKKPVKTAEFLKEKNKNKFPNVKSNLNYHTIGGINEGLYDKELAIEINDLLKQDYTKAEIGRKLNIDDSLINPIIKFLLPKNIEPAKSKTKGDSKTTA